MVAVGRKRPPTAAVSGMPRSAGNAPQAPLIPAYSSGPTGIWTLTQLNLHPMQRSVLPQSDQGDPSIQR